MAAGANLRRVRFGRMVSDASDKTQREREMQLDKDIAAIKKALDENPAIRLIIIDPVSNYLGATKMTDEQAVRRVLAPLNTLAAETGVTILGVMHLNKKGDLKAINRVGGAMAFVGVARAVWLFAADDKQNDLFYMLRLKNNISEREGGLMYRIATKPVQIEGEAVPEPYIEWLGETEKSADSVLTPRPAGRPNNERQAAAEWLKDYLSEGPRLSTEVEAQCETAGFKYRTLERCKDDMGVKVTREGGHWQWELPKESRSPES
jgi:putative DNA primase/helicase